MVGVPLARRSKRRTRPTKNIVNVLQYAAIGWAAAPGAHPLTRGARACSCDRLGCPEPGAHPVTPAWRIQATTDTAQLTRWWEHDPEANVILPTGRIFDVFDVPRAAGLATLTRMDAKGQSTGPVAESGDRVLFFVATRGAPEDDEEWWSCDLDYVPATIDETPGLRWHCRESYVLAPPSALPGGATVTWLRAPSGLPLPDPLVLLAELADCI